MAASQQARPKTPDENFRELYKRTAELNDKVSALLSPAWGSEMGLIPSEHPLYQGEKPSPAQEEQGAPVDWQAIAERRERELKKVDMARYLAEQELARLRAGEEPGWDPATVPTPGQWITRWNAASAEERLEVARQVIEDRARAARCFLENHEKRLARSEPPIIGTARIALDVQPGIVSGCSCGLDTPLLLADKAGTHIHAGLADGIASEERSDRRVALPAVEMTGAASLPLGDRVDRGFVLAGGTQSKILIDGRRLAVSADKPVVVEPFGPGVPGGNVTLTLNCERVTIDGKEVGDA